MKKFFVFLMLIMLGMAAYASEVYVVSKYNYG